MILETGRNKKGFTLIEVMVSIAILSLGLILILQGFARSLSILNIAENNLRAVLLAEENMVGFEMNSRNPAYFSDAGGDIVLNNVNFTWQVKSFPSGEYENLNDVSSIVSWKWGRDKGTVSLASCLRIPPDEYK
jgi:prepilin-type N-terminal cleavage/methylation domain-containing protein